MDDTSDSIGACGAGGVVRVFVSYRRDDVPDATDRLALSLKSHLGKDQVFLDVDSIDIGARFAKVVGDWVGRCDVLLAVIGKGWLEATDDEGKRRLEDPRDYVRLEVEAGLDRDIRVVPVLIHGARMPKAAELPNTLVPLLDFNAVELSRAHWDFDVDRLVAALERIAVGKAVEDAERERTAQAEAERQATGRDAAEHQGPERDVAEREATIRNMAEPEQQDEREPAEGKGQARGAEGMQQTSGGFPPRGDEHILVQEVKPPGEGRHEATKRTQGTPKPERDKRRKLLLLAVAGALVVVVVMAVVLATNPYLH